MNGNYVYMVAKKSVYEDQEVNDLIRFVTTNIDDALCFIGYDAYIYDNDLIVCDVHESKVYNINYTNKRINESPSFKGFFGVNNDEYNNVVACIQDWNDERDAFLQEKKIKAEKAIQEKQDEHDRLEYERLKKKFEGR